MTRKRGTIEPGITVRDLGQGCWDLGLYWPARDLVDGSVRGRRRLGIIMTAIADGIAQVTVARTGGLSSAEAADRLAQYGPNELPRARRTPAWRLIADQLRDPLILVLLAAVVLTVATGDLADASVIVLVIVVNTTVGVV
jgi:Ca2+-transporting ATPase